MNFEQEKQKKTRQLRFDTQIHKREKSFNFSGNFELHFKMTPEELKEFVEQCETKFANR